MRHPALWLTAVAAAAVGGAVAGVIAAPLRSAEVRYQRGLQAFEARLRRSTAVEEVNAAWVDHLHDLVERPIDYQTTRRPVDATRADTGRAPAAQLSEGRLTGVTVDLTIGDDAPAPATENGGIGGPMPSTSGVGPLRVDR